MVTPPIHEVFERRLVTKILRLTERNVVAINQPRQIQVEEGRRGLVRLVEFQQYLIKLERLQRGRIGVGDVLADLPRQKLFRGREYRAVGGHFKSVLRFGGGLFARGVESQRFLPDEVVEGRTIGIRERAFLQQAVEGGDGGGLEAVRAGEGGLK